jgi:hypothetical protein
MHPVHSAVVHPLEGAPVTRLSFHDMPMEQPGDGRDTQKRTCVKA